MKKLKRSFTLVCILLQVLTIGCFTSCSQKEKTESLNNETSSFFTNDYSITPMNGKYYITFIENTDFGQSDVASVDFETIADFKDKVTQGDLSDYQKATVASAFPKDENGILCCDFNNLYFPSLPNGWDVDGVYWEGENYSFSITTNNGTFGYVHCYSKDVYEEKFQRDYKDYFKKDTVNVTKTESFSKNKTATYYSTKTSELMNLRYELSEKNISTTVDKTYLINSLSSVIQTSSSHPYNITLYCAQGDLYYVVDIFEISKEPSDEYLMKFRMDKYKDKN